MNNKLCEPEVIYGRLKKSWITKKNMSRKHTLEGGYAPFINEMTRIRFSQRAIHTNKNPLTDELDYHKYHFSDNDLKFNREEINER